MKKIGIGVLAVAFMSNCFLTGYLNEGLKPYNTVTGAQAKDIIGAAAGSAWTTALQMYGTSLKARKLAEISGSYSHAGSADVGDVYEQRALAGVIAAASKTIVDSEYYTIASVNDCVDNIRNTMVGFGQGRIEEADKAAANCLQETSDQIQKVDGDFNKIVVNTCFDGSGNAITAAGGAFTAICGACVATMGHYTGTKSTTQSALAAQKYGQRVMGFYGNHINSAVTGNQTAVATDLTTARDGCMDAFMAAVAAVASKKQCGSKFGEERLHEALSTTAFMGAQRCQLKKAGSIIQTDFFSL